MTIQQNIIQQLSDLTENGVTSTIHHTSTGRSVALTTGVEDVQATITLTDYDTYSVVLQQLDLTHPPINSNLTEWGEKLCAQILYLDEPLVVVEVEQSEPYIQLRSNPPHTVDETLNYWELLVHGDTTTLNRYQKSADQPRIVTPHPLTFNLIGRFISDYTELVQKER